jgi:hypothetical protein
MYNDLDRVDGCEPDRVSNGHSAVSGRELSSPPKALGGRKAPRQQLVLDPPAHAREPMLGILRDGGERLADPRTAHQCGGKKDIWTHVHVVVRVDVGWCGSVGSPKALDLVAYSIRYEAVNSGVGAKPPAPCPDICEMAAEAKLTLPHSLGDPRTAERLGKVEVQPDRSSTLSGELRGSDRVRHMNHRRGRADRTRLEARLDRLGALAEAAPVVGVDD